MIKYRVKTNSKKILGPFLYEELLELGRSGAFDEQSLFQKFPTGDWGPSDSIPEISKLLKEINRRSESREVKYARTDSEQNTHTLIGEDAAKFNEFKFSKDAEQIDYSEIEEKYNAKKELEEEVVEEDDEPELEKTVLVKMPKKEVEEIEKTVVVNSADLRSELEESASDNSQDSTKSEVIVEEEPEEEIDTDGATVVVDLSELKKLKEEKTTTEDYSDLEVQIRQEERKTKKKTKKPVRVEKKKVKKPAKKRNLTIALFLVVAIIFLLPEEEKEVETVLVPKVTFPVAQEIAAPLKAKAAYIAGNKLYKSGEFIDKIKAAESYNKSLSYKFANNPAVYKLVKVYSDLLIDLPGNRKFEAGKVINKLIKIERSQLLNNIDLVIGAAQFYAFFGKYETAIDVIERYNYVKANKPSIKLFSIYLDYLLKTGELTKSKIVYGRLKDSKLKTIDSIAAMVNYNLLNERPKEALNLITEHKGKYSKSYRFLAIYGELLLELENMKMLKTVSSILIAKYGGGSPYLFAQGLKFNGFVKAYANDIQSASKLFARSLEIYEDDSLRDTLATLDVEGGDLTKKVISTSKIKVLIRRSKEEVNVLNWDKAFELALNAVATDETSIDAKLYLSELQIRRGYFDFAIKTLTKLRAMHPVNPRVNYALIKANIMSFKKNEAQRLLSSLSTNEKFRVSYEFYMLLGHYYKLIENDIMSFDKFKAAIKVNPLSDDAYYEMAKIAYINKKFKRTRRYLTEAISLNPSNIDFKILNSKVLFETDGIEVAIGYLRKELLSYRDNPKILGQIAVFYYQDQSFDEYRETKEILDRLNTKDGSLYIYLVEVAEIEKNNKDLIDNAVKLLVYEPGNLKIREKLIITYINTRKYVQALKQIDTLEQRLPTYPRLNYYRSKIYFEQRQYKKSELAALEEVKSNPNSEYGFYMLGEIYLRAKRVNESKKNLAKAIQINQNFFEAIFSMGKLNYQTRDFGPARELFQRAYRLNDRHAELNKMMGFLYKEIGQPTFAIESFERYLTLSPTASDRENINALINQLKN